MHQSARGGEPLVSCSVAVRVNPGPLLLLLFRWSGSPHCRTASKASDYAISRRVQPWHSLFMGMFEEQLHRPWFAAVPQRMLCAGAVISRSLRLVN